MKNGTKSIEFGEESYKWGINLESVDYKFKMGSKPIVSLSKQPKTCLHRGKI